MESKRQLKFSKMIQKDLGDIFHHEIQDIIGKAFITVTQVRMSPDLGVAKAYLSMMMVDDKQMLIEHIIERKSTIRRLLSNRIGKKVRVVPDLMFYIDDSLEYSANIERILKNLDIPPEQN
jgi:ribosome-binding factor A